MTYEECRLKLEKILNCDVYLNDNEDEEYMFHLHEFGCYIIAGVLNDKTYGIDTMYPSFNTLDDNLKSHVLSALIELTRTLPKDRVKKQKCDKPIDKNIKNEFKTLLGSGNTVSNIEDGWLVVTRNKGWYIKIKDVLIDKNNGFMPCSDYKYSNGIFSVESTPFESMRKFDKEFDILEIWKPKYEHLSLSYNLEDRDLVWCNRL